MKKLVIALLLGLLIAGSVFAQWVYGYNPAPQTITGTLQIINGIFAIVNVNKQVYYVPGLQPYYGTNGMYLNTTVTVYGNITNNFCVPYSFMVYGTWYSCPVYNYYVPPTLPVYAPVYIPMYAPPLLPRAYVGWYR